MGLDSFWVDPKADKVMELPEPMEQVFPLQICGGILSAHGSGSFRGKVYNSLIESITGESLYQDRIPNETIKEMAFLLQEAAEKGVPDGIEPEEFRDLVIMFQLYADAGAELRGWW